MQKIYRVQLSSEEREQLQQLVKKGDGPKGQRPSALKLTRARILLKADQAQGAPAYTDAEIAEALDVSPKTVFNIRKRWVELGLEQALERRPQQNRCQPKLDGKAEAKLIACSCGPPPEGRSKWTLKLLATKAVELELVDSISRETVRQTLKKNVIKPWLTQSWCLPKEHDAEFVWRMEDVLDVYARPYDPRFPVICMDEASKQLVGEVRDPLPRRPGDPLRIDSEYVRLGTCNLFLFCEPLRGWRHVRVTNRRTKVDWAYALRDFLQDFYAEAEKIILVMDNLNTHTPGSFYEAFDPQVARALTERLEIHYTPKHGSWLNIAECEFSVLQRQCLDRRIEDAEFLGREVNAWQDARNATDSTINWQFTTEASRVKLRRLYPEYLRQDTGQNPPVPTAIYN